MMCSWFAQSHVTVANIISTPTQSYVLHIMLQICYKQLHIFCEKTPLQLILWELSHHCNKLHQHANHSAGSPALANNELQQPANHSSSVRRWPGIDISPVPPTSDDDAEVIIGVGC